MSTPHDLTEVDPVLAAEAERLMSLCGFHARS